jgi:peptide deformylase
MYEKKKQTEVLVPKRAIWEDCNIPPFGEYREPSFQKCYTICDSVKRDTLQHLLNHMEVHIPPNHDIVGANEFGANVRVIFMKRRNLFLINPIIQDTSQEARIWDKCLGQTVWRSKYIHVKYLNRELKEMEQSFSNVDALQLQCVYSTFNT